MTKQVIFKRYVQNQPSLLPPSLEDLVAEKYPVHPDILTSLNSATRLGQYFNTANKLLPMAFPEGSPTHPAYGAGHATVAGACTTILKAWFDESFVIPNPVVTDATGRI